jgi:hypothetical protein
VSEQPPDDPPDVADEPNEYPEHAMTAADASALLAKEIG